MLKCYRIKFGIFLYECPPMYGAFLDMNYICKIVKKCALNCNNAVLYPGIQKEYKYEMGSKHYI